MKPNQIVIWGVLLWLLVVLAGVLHGVLHEPARASYLSGLEGVLIFLFWQAGALGVAVLVFVIRLVIGKDLTGVARWLGFAPIVVSGGFVLLVAGFVAFQS